MGDQKLGAGFKAGYSLGYVGISSMFYIIFFTFFLFFMTNIVGISPIYAGTISMIAVLWDGISDPLVGYFSDNSRNKNGRRRPYMIKGIVIAAVSLVLVFTKVPFQNWLQNVYYLVMGMIFWTGVTMFDIPYNSLIMEITPVQTERASIRNYIMFLCVAGSMLMMGTIFQIVGFFTETRGSDTGGWQAGVACVAVFGSILAVISWRISKGREIPNTEVKAAEHRENPLKMIAGIFRCKPYKYLVSSSFIIGLINSLLMGSLVYWYSYKLGFSTETQTLLFMLGPGLSFVWPILLEVAVRKLKNDYRIYMITILISLLSFLVFQIFIGVKTVPGVLAFYVFACLCSAIALWVFGFTFSYCIAELDAFETGKDHSGGFVAYESFAIKMGTAVGTWVIGFILERGGYDPGLAEQSAKTLGSINNLVSWYPAIFYIIVLVILIFYPLKQKQYNALKTALKQKEAGEKYSIEGFKNCLSKKTIKEHEEAVKL